MRLRLARVGIRSLEWLVLYSSIWPVDDTIIIILTITRPSGFINYSPVCALSWPLRRSFYFTFEFSRTNGVFVQATYWEGFPDFILLHCSSHWYFNARQSHSSGTGKYLRVIVSSWLNITSLLTLLAWFWLSVVSSYHCIFYGVFEPHVPKDVVLCSHFSSVAGKSALRISVFSFTRHSAYVGIMFSALALQASFDSFTPSGFSIRTYHVSLFLSSHGLFLMHSVSNLI